MCRSATRPLHFCILTSLVLVYSVCIASQEGFIPAMPVANQVIEYPRALTPPLPEATITLVASVNEQGGVDSVVILRPGSPELNEAATQTISKWRFIPARQDGKPVRSQANIDVFFVHPHPYAVCNGVNRVGVGGVTPPRAIKAPDPEYTKAARKAKIAGTVVLWLVVNEKGLPEQIRIQKSLDPGLDQKAADAVKRWKFDPARKDGQPVAVMINVEVNFRLY